MIATEDKTDWQCGLVAKHCTACDVPGRCSGSRRDRDVVRAYYTLYPAGHWFDDDTNRFFGTRLGGTIRTERGNYLFVSSELPPHSKRKYTVRLLRTDADSVRNGKHVEDVSEFCEYASRSAAVRRMEREAVNH
jgi:hypothetical protein